LAKESKAKARFRAVGYDREWQDDAIFGFQPVQEFLFPCLSESRLADSTMPSRTATVIFFKKGNAKKDRQQTKTLSAKNAKEAHSLQIKIVG
jgi:hypothetical protein